MVPILSLSWIPANISWMPLTICWMEFHGRKLHLCRLHCWHFRTNDHIRSHAFHRLFHQPLTFFNKIPIVLFMDIAYNKGTENVAAYWWCDYKLFGMNILSPPLWWGFLLRRFMKIQSGFYYHIKNTFFEEIQDSALMSNKEDGNYRPHHRRLLWPYTYKQRNPLNIAWRYCKIDCR